MQYFHCFVRQSGGDDCTFGGGEKHVVRDGNEFEEVIPVLGFRRLYTAIIAAKMSHGTVVSES